jgi:iron complex transport system substrate-binding protein
VHGVPERIVSMAPNVTEILFALGLGDRVVGVTRYCAYPPEAAGLPKVGGHLDPNLEAIVAQRPDLVVLLDEQRETIAALRKLGVPVLAIRDNSVEEILTAIRSVGERCRAEATAQELIADLRRRIHTVEQHTAGLPRPRVLVVIDRSVDVGTIEDVYVAGHDGYFDHLVAMAGGQNAYRGPRVAYPVVSIEGIVSMAPEVIIDLPAGEPQNADGRALADWQHCPQVPAVSRQQVYALRADYARIPGPRFILLLEALADRIHPETDLSQ